MTAPRHDAPNRYLLAATALAACALLIAGLWPFQFFTTNHAVYDRSTGCLLCDRFTSAYLPLRIDGDRRAMSLAVECRFLFKAQSSYPYVARILTLYDMSARTEVITIGQWERNLVVRVRKTGNTTGLPIVAEQDADSFFIGRSRSTITLRVDRSMVSVSNCRRVMEFSNPLLPDTAIMVFGNSPWGDSPWNGRICLQVKDTCRTPTDSLAAISGRAPALVIPRFFRPVAMMAIKPLWQDFTMSRWYARDIALNFAGFAPFGFLLTVLLHRRLRLSSLTAAAIGTGMGLSISVVIELLQIILPYRSSQMSDVVFNTLGTAFGAALFVFWSRLSTARKRLDGINRISNDQQDKKNSTE